MKRKIFTILLLVTVLLTLCTALPTAAAEDLLKNGDFEVTSGAKPSDWYLGGGTIEDAFRLDKTEKHGGTQSFAIVNSGTAILYANQCVTTITPEADYKLSVWAKNDKSAAAAMKLEFYSTTAFAADSATGAEQLLVIPAATDWKEFSLEFTAPPRTKMIAVYMRNYATGTVWFDDMSLTQVGGAPIGDKGKSVVTNGSFENLTGGNSAANWYFGGGTGAFQIAKSGAHTGNHAVKITNENNAILFANQAITAVYPGADYEMSIWANTTAATGAAIKAEFYNQPGTFSADNATGPEVLLQLSATGGTWQEFTKSFTAPAGTKSIVLYFRFYGVGEVLFDDFSLCTVGAVPNAPAVEETPIEEPTEKTPVSGAVDMMKNGSMETGGNVTPESWNYFERGDSEVSRSEEEAYTGKASLKITTQEPNAGKNLACAGQTIQNVVAGAVYQFTAYIKNFDSAAYFKFEPSSAETPVAGSGLGESRTPNFGLRSGEWTKVVFLYTAPDNCRSINFYLRQAATGTTYWDDVTCYMVEEPTMLAMETDKYFYYPDQKQGVVTVALPAYFEKYSDSPLTLTVKDGDNVLYETKTTVSTEAKNLLYDLSCLTQKKHEYTVTTTVSDASGAVLATESKPAFVYDRPTLLNEKGYFVVDGKPFFPMYTNTVSKKESYEKIAGMGCNTTIVYMQHLESYLEEAEKYNLKLVVPLYVNMKPAGGVENAAGTKKLVEKFKDNKSVLAWAIMDEPFSQHCTEEDLLNSYRIIRDIDDMHPVYSVEALHTDYKKVAKFVDLLVTDPYPQNTYPPASYVADMNKKAQEAVEFDKPIFSIVQSYLYNGYYPTEDELRSQIYQSIFENVEGVGFFRYENAIEGKNLDEVELGNTIRTFVSNELEDAAKAFVFEEYPVFNDHRKSDIWYRTYCKNGELYCIVLNRNTAPVTATVDMTSFDGSIVLDGYKMTVVCGTAAGEIASAGSTATILLQSAAAAVYKVTPNTPTDFSGLTRMAFEQGGFADTYRYAWASPQISKLAQAGIVNKISAYLYGPEQNITRGDLAMFLVRTLGLTAESADNFTDVAPDSVYAKELAIGKAAGILRGVGDNKFNPEAEITRQDMMTIIGRGMQLTGESDLAVFSDGGAVADYAAPYVKAMIAAGLIRGNADGTLNPIGNTTRAEAAVIMERIMQ